MAYDNASWRKGKTTGERGYDGRWQAARAAYLRENPLCVRCHEAGLLVPAGVVDHIERHQGDQKLFWRRSNWQALCTACHAKKTAEELGRRTRPRIGADGWPERE